MAKEKIFKFRDGDAPIKEGQMVVVTNGQGGRHFQANEALVEKVGRDLIHIGRHGSWFLKTGRKKTDFTSGSVYSSMEAYLRVSKEEGFIEQVRSRLQGYGFKMSYEQAQQISKILGLEIKYGSQESPF